MKNKELGNLFEDKALLFLQNNGLKLLERNFHSRYGEIDIIMLDNKILCFIEVKARKNHNHGTPQEFVNTAKQRKIISTAQYYLQAHKKYQKSDCRFDVIAITHENNNTDINWIKNAFTS